MGDSMSAEDRLAVHDLLARYAWALDTGDYETYAALYTPDGVFVERGRAFRGRDAIRDHVRELAGRMARGNRHHNTQLLFEEAAPERCRLRSYSTHIYQPQDGTPGVIRMQGYYRDVCVKLDGAWYFQERVWDEWDPDALADYRPPPR
jgi:uncharacterized protein (TIGR02246 family)